MIFIFIIIVVIGITYLFFTTYPAFGGKAKGERKIRIRRSTNWQNGKFVNLMPTVMGLPPSKLIGLLREQLRKKNGRPTQPLTPKHPDAALLATPEPPRITWFGHSAFLLHIQGKIILLDPMFGISPSPLPAIGPKRFSNGLPVEVTDLPHIDAVIISHDHYDHLDYPSITQLKHKVDMFFVPLGIGAHLERWGVPSQNIIELDWWDEYSYKDLRLACTPARHFSGRTLTDRDATLWASWVIKGSGSSVFFSGDGGYGPHFKDIGDKYGPFDLTLMECGQYSQYWPTIHMMPEETARAHVDLRGKKMIPMHWGAFVLSLHSWTEPVDRVLVASEKHGSTILTPEIGEVVAFMENNNPKTAWWHDLDKDPELSTP